MDGGLNEDGSKWSVMVRLTGIEPVTPSFGNWYSIQLSYRRIFECFDAERNLDQSVIILALISDC